MNPVRAGQFDQRVVIERLVDPPPRNEFGEPIETWEVYAARWAAVEPLGGSEKFYSQMTQTAMTHRIRLRYDSVTREIHAAMRLQHGGKVYDLEEPLNPETSNEQIHVMAKVRS
jgi:SPP1 family predicted phage head-tail adaptor